MAKNQHEENVRQGILAREALERILERLATDPMQDEELAATCRSVLGKKEKPREPNNATRARDAEVALTAHVETQFVPGFRPDLTAGDPEDLRDALVDLLTNLRHWAREEDVDYAAADQMAAVHFKAELSEA